MQRRYPLTTLTAILFLLACVWPMPSPALVFGDGDPDNGVEDDRLLAGDDGSSPELRHWLKQAGTIACDGAVRGTAALASLPGAGRDRSARVLVTAAHIFFDLERDQRWQRCFYHHEGMAERPGYRVPLRWEWVQFGKFDPATDPSQPQHGAGDFAFVWLGDQWTPPADTPGFTLGTLSARAPGPFGLALVAWHSERQQLSVVARCQGVWSDREDLGGGLWSGQLLDDCDDAYGASGGAILRLEEGSVTLVAVRGGSHHAASLGLPVAGSLWHTQQRTNYARAFDQSVLLVLGDFIRQLAGGVEIQRDG